MSSQCPACVDGTNGSHLKNGRNQESYKSPTSYQSHQRKPETGNLLRTVSKRGIHRFGRLPGTATQAFPDGGFFSRKLRSHANRGS